MAAKNDSKFLWLGGGVAAFAGYEFLVKPWLAAKNAAAAAGGTVPSLFSPPATSSLLSTPTSLYAPGGVQGSIVDPRLNPGGDVGQAMWRKNWTQAVATARLNALKAAYSAAMGSIQQAKSGPNPNAAGIPAAQQALAQNLASAAAADARAAQDLANGDQAGAAKWQAAAAAARQDAQSLQSRIAAASNSGADPAAIAAWEGAAAGHKADYFALTGMTIPGG